MLFAPFEDVRTEENSDECGAGEGGERPRLLPSEADGEGDGCGGSEQCSCRGEDSQPSVFLPSEEIHDGEGEEECEAGGFDEGGKIPEDREDGGT